MSQMEWMREMTAQLIDVKKDIAHLKEVATKLDLRLRMLENPLSMFKAPVPSSTTDEGVQG